MRLSAAMASDAGSGDYGSGSLDGSASCKQIEAWGIYLGVGMGVFGSIGINIGQNLQAAGLKKLPLEQRAKPCGSRQWIIGMIVFVSFSMLNFAALAFAPASILTPLESIQFVTNVVYNRLVNRAVVSVRMLLGVGLALVGTVLSVVFGASGSGCHTSAQLEAFWMHWSWWVYLAGSLSLGLAAWIVHRVYAARLAANPEKPPPYYRLVMPICFTLSSALFGGAQMIVHSKVFSELLGLLFASQEVGLFTGWLLYVELVLVTGCGILWVVKLTECLGLFDPLLILPLMVGTYILFGGMAGGIFFQEFRHLHRGLGGALGWPLYILGFVAVLAGLCLIAIASAEIDRALQDDEDAESASDSPISPSDVSAPVDGLSLKTPERLPRPPPILTQSSGGGSTMSLGLGSSGAIERARARTGVAMPTPMHMRSAAKLQLRQSWDPTTNSPLPQKSVSASTPTSPNTLQRSFYRSHQHLFTEPRSPPTRSRANSADRTRSGGPLVDWSMIFGGSANKASPPPPPPHPPHPPHSGSRAQGTPQEPVEQTGGSPAASMRRNIV